MPGEPPSVPANISSNLAPLLQADTPAEFRKRAASRGYVTSEQGVAVSIRTKGLTAADKANFMIEGVTVRIFSVKYQRVSATVHSADALREIAGLPAVRYIAPRYGATIGHRHSGPDSTAPQRGDTH